MNVIHKIIWNANRRTWIAVAETVRGRSRSGKGKKLRAMTALVPLGIVILTGEPAFANYTSDVFSGTVYNESIDDGGVQLVDCQYAGMCGTAISTTISWGTQTIRSTVGDYNAASGTILRGTSYLGVPPQYAVQNVYNGSAYDTVVMDNGVLNVYGGKVEYATVTNAYDRRNADGVMNVSGGSVSNARIWGGRQYVYAGNVDYTDIGDGGVQVVSGGNVSGTTIEQGLQQVLGGTVVGTTINNGGVSQVLNGGVTRSMVINAGGLQVVSAGGIASDAKINNGGTLSVSAGGTATAVTQNAGGALVANTDTNVTGTNALGAFSIDA
ncbi:MULTISPECIES: ESPR domain-containing protein, partial [Paraburkholderia]|uniref:ESPR domain-containing protein n=1 Tax=Paraburkholderia TaxID=1822464 RepID=UPI002255A5C7